MLMLDGAPETVGPQVAMEVLGFGREKFYKLLKLGLLPVQPLPQAGDPKWSTRQLINYLEGKIQALHGLRRMR